MQLIKTNEEKWLDKKGYSKKIFLNEKDLNHPGALVQMIKIKAGKTAASHHHKVQREIFYFLSNNGYFIVDGEKISLNIGDLLVIEPNEKHIVVNDTKKDFIYLAFKTDYSENDLYWD